MAVYKHLISALGTAVAGPAAVSTLDALLQLELSRELERLQDKVRKETPGNPAASGFKVYSQADEDGILEAIFDRLGIREGTFVEIGCGNGLENNTHYLLLKGWRGVWVDGNASNISAIRNALPESSRLGVLEAMVDRDNAPQLLNGTALRKIDGLDLLSVDIDGNDLEVAAACAAVWQPTVIVVEYNAKFPPSAAVKITYNPAHRWNHDDYHGASLRAWVDVLSAYSLVTCNLAGTNAFFVKRESADAFEKYSLESLYQPSRFYLTALRSGHRASAEFLAQNLRAEE